jgi:uncharacterized SAM-binding protein YcdF (DUF218 family)
VGFFLKKVVSALVMPLPALLLLTAAGLWMGVRSRRKRAGWTLAGFALVSLWALSTDPVADALIRRAESSAPRFPGDSVDFVVVLGGGHVTDPALPLSARLNSQTLPRLVEGLTIATAQPWSRLVLLGWAGADPMSGADAYRALAQAMGFPHDRITVEDRAMDTRQEAERMEPLLRGHRFALVTSAFHMDRSLELFRARGLDPVPAPTAHLAGESGAFDALALVPDADNLLRSRFAWHEILGRIWARLIGAT